VTAPESTDSVPLDRGLQALGLAATPAQREQLLGYLSELRRWNASYNLVGRGELDALVTRHLLDSLVIGPAVHGTTVLDVGTGAGFPGLPLAIMNPHWQLTLLDSAGKKVRFLNHVVRHLGLGNVTTVAQRVENYSPAGEFSTIVSRAFASLAAFGECTRRLGGPATRWLAMKGRQPDEELATLPRWLQVQKIQRLAVPGLDAERHLVVLAPRSE
jgi:16S rRNA (guanine527-N7)-methyltransferase